MLLSWEMSPLPSRQQQGCHCPEFVQLCQQLFTVGEYQMCCFYRCHQFQFEVYFSLDLQLLRKQLF